MNKAKKAGLILVLIGICLPTATLPLITEFKPVPELCLTSNFFQNLGNMIVVFGSYSAEITSGSAQPVLHDLSIPYKYLFSTGVILICLGLGIIVVNSGRGKKKR